MYKSKKPVEQRHYRLYADEKQFLQEGRSQVVTGILLG